MLTREGHVRVTDFGLSKENCTATNLMKTFGGTPQYMAPEIWKLENGQSEGYGFSVDWWTLGVLTYEMLLGRTPFHAKEQVDLYIKIKREEPRYPPHLQKTAKVRSMDESTFVGK